MAEVRFGVWPDQMLRFSFRFDLFFCRKDRKFGWVTEKYTSTCPDCSATVEFTEEDQGTELSCPGCKEMLEIPEIRMGLIPGRSPDQTDKKGKYPSTLLGRDVMAAELLVDNLASLYRRNEALGVQMDQLIENATMCSKSIELIVESARKQPHPLSGSPQTERSLSEPAGKAVAVAGVTVFAAVVVLVLLVT
jgi:hypothetical protein